LNYARISGIKFILLYCGKLAMFFLIALTGY